jgi:hypothetical protein
MLEDYGFFFQTCEVGELTIIHKRIELNLSIKLHRKVKEKDFPHNLATCWNPFSKYGDFIFVFFIKKRFQSVFFKKNPLYMSNIPPSPLLFFGPYIPLKKNQW